MSNPFRFRYAWLVLAALLSAALAYAQLTLPAILGDHMVLQRDMPVPVWGMATPGSRVAVSFAGQTVATQADSGGYWMLRLAPLATNSTTQDMTVTETDNAGKTISSLEVRDVLVGEVWLAGGQSNMAYGLKAMEGSDAYLAAPTNPQLRLFNVAHATAAEPIGMHQGEKPGDVDAGWALADSRSAASFSAVGYLFAAELQKTLQCPVGIISSNWGGTPIKTWMSMDAFAASPQLAPFIEEYQKALATHQQVLAHPEMESAYQAAEKLWRQQVGDPYDAAMKLWFQAQASGADPGPRPKPERPEPQNPDLTGMPNSETRPQTPSISWNAMFAPIVPYALRGVLWYQGEANVSQYREYGLQLRTMVEDWRRKWAEPNLEFLCVQLPGFGNNEETSDLAHLREQQVSVLQLPHTGLAITWDVGDPGNVHPASKVDVAHRLALIARGQVYHEPVEYSGPTERSVAISGPEVRVSFDHVAACLIIGQAPWIARDDQPIPTNELLGFTLAGADGVFHPATAKIDGDAVVLRAPDVPAPRYVRFAWDNTPRANLYNSAHLPAAPFRTDPQP